MDKANVVHTHTGIIFSQKKEKKSCICDNMSEPRKVILNEISQRKTLYDLKFLWNLKESNSWKQRVKYYAEPGS